MRVCKHHPLKNNYIEQPGACLLIVSVAEKDHTCLNGHGNSC